MQFKTNIVNTTERESMTKDQTKAPRHDGKISQPFKFIEFDIYLEKPFRFLGIWKNQAEINGVTSRFYVVNVSSLHFSFEVFKKSGRFGGLRNEIDDQAAGGDGCVHR